MENNQRKIEAALSSEDNTGIKVGFGTLSDRKKRQLRKDTFKVLSSLDGLSVTVDNWQIVELMVLDREIDLIETFLPELLESSTKVKEVKENNYGCCTICACSTSKQAVKDLSIPDQLRQMRDWCRKQGYAVAVEYIEPGATATDDRRVVFQQMIAEACMSPSPFEAIVVHSFSRFFRDALEFGLYERQLNKHGVKLISITQQTSEDPAGEMARKIFSLFDEYQSKENAKHTLRAMKENARRGFFNGSRPSFGFKVVETK
jgi:DNA invertase Pin-like site-specific DNA recombinase